MSTEKYGRIEANEINKAKLEQEMTQNKKIDLKMTKNGLKMTKNGLKLTKNQLKLHSVYTRRIVKIVPNND